MEADPDAAARGGGQNKNLSNTKNSLMNERKSSLSPQTLAIFCDGFAGRTEQKQLIAPKPRFNFFRGGSLYYFCPVCQ